MLKQNYCNPKQQKDSTAVTDFISAWISGEFSIKITSINRITFKLYKGDPWRIKENKRAQDHLPVVLYFDGYAPILMPDKCTGEHPYHYLCLINQLYPHISG